MIGFYPAELLTAGREKTSMLESFAVMEMRIGNGIRLTCMS